MPSRTIASLAHGLSAAIDLDAAFIPSVEADGLLPLAGAVANSRAPMRVVGTEDAVTPPLLGDEYLTTVSFKAREAYLPECLMGAMDER